MTAPSNLITVLTVSIPKDLPLAERQRVAALLLDIELKTAWPDGTQTTGSLAFLD